MTDGPVMDGRPLVGTAEEIAAVNAEIAAYRAEGLDLQAVDFKRLCMKKARLTRPRAGRHALRLKEAALRAKLREQMALNAKDKFIQLVDSVDARPLLARLMKLANEQLLDALVRRLKSKPCRVCGQTGKDAARAEEQLLDLVSNVFRVQRAKEPAKSEKPRGIVIREWPEEGVKG